MSDRRWAQLGQLLQLSFKLGTAQFKTRNGPAGVLLAPGFMLAGALGLFALWSASPLGQTDVDSGLSLGIVRVFYAHDTLEAPQAASDRADAVLSVARVQELALSTALAKLGAPATAVHADQPNSRESTEVRLDSLQRAEQRMVRSSAVYAHNRADGLRRAFRIAGVSARTYEQAGRRTGFDRAAGLSTLELRNSRVLAARFDVDRDLARRVQRAAEDLIAAHGLEISATRLPFGVPVDDPVRSSRFGLRIDPFTGQLAFHPGQDFSGRAGQKIRSTAPGVVTFAGQRSGYGNCVEIDHGDGFKTRYGHLRRIGVQLGATIDVGSSLGEMGSTGRSTGVHLHYEIWQNGHLEDPARFLQAGEALQRAEERHARA